MIAWPKVGINFRSFEFWQFGRFGLPAASSLFYSSPFFAFGVAAGLDITTGKLIFTCFQKTSNVCHRRVFGVPLARRDSISWTVQHKWQRLLDLSKKVVDCQLEEGKKMFPAVLGPFFPDQECSALVLNVRQRCLNSSRSWDQSWPNWRTRMRELLLSGVSKRTWCLPPMTSEDLGGSLLYFHWWR